MSNQLTPEELLDIVDEKGKVLYQATKQEAHLKGLLHQTVIGGVKNSQGRIMLVKQSSTRQDAGQFVSPVGGHVRHNETADQAIEREAEEELGLKNISYKLIGKKVFNREVLGKKENHYFIVYEILTNEMLRLNHEAESFEVFTEDELKEKLKTNPKMFGAAYHFVIQNFYPSFLAN